ncbi:MAG TPA: hypothetical protein EYQ50_24375, partial [Verrucomicrobiales bacterium]|nr:hypothetical protein [Verrucomicrobiales bacterium]
MITPNESESNVDWFIFTAGILMIIGVTIPIVLFPDWSESVISVAFNFLTRELGFVYVVVADVILLFVVAVGVSPWGRTRLGDSPPAYSRFSWAAMLFCAGIGASLIYWGATEWAFYYTAPPFGVTPGSDEAVRWATSYGIFHWGPIGWALYCLPTIALCCSYYLRGIPVLRLSAACASVLGNRTDHWPARMIDLVFVIGLLGTAATGLGLGTSVVASAATRLVGVADGFGMQFTVILLITGVIAVSVYKGMDKGIKVLSVINASLALVFIAFVLVAGPTMFIIEMGVSAVGHVLANFVNMATWNDSDFVADWTVFYWAWWLALGPFVGMFVCKISQGRTIREVIFGMLGWGSLGCALFFVVLGNYALQMELEGSYPVVEQAVALSPSAAIAGI